MKSEEAEAQRKIEQQGKDAQLLHEPSVHFPEVSKPA